ncbi:hypothetical protein [Candidatus Mesenet endosymbiont of Agriotes lineatus]|uniref:hypothetical protein n=1 Tax=Candidatus Mesenet endosymbiont of Agriotes lineatus TaxID=3077948 RepID=UPI0030CB4AC4
MFKEIYNLSKKELNHINNFVENFNFTEKEIEYLEKIVKKYAKEFELLKVEQEFDIFEKAQLNHAEISKAVNKQSRKV